MELTKIRGINEKREQDFNKAGVYNTYDLARYFPRRYLDLREKQLLKYAYHNDVVLTAGKIINKSERFYRRGGGTIRAVCEQEGFVFNIVWFNQPYVLSKLNVGEDYLFYGRVRREDGIVSIINPSFELCDKVFRLQGIVPQYTLKGNLTQKVVRDAARLSVDIEKPKSLIPNNIIEKYNLIDLYSAYRQVHNPKDFASEQAAADRIAVEEYFALISAFKVIKGSREQVRINKYNCTAESLKNFAKHRFNFEFTEGQKQAVNEIFKDMTGAKVMNRLLQGDVGSGKTAVSMCAVHIAVSSGYQAAILAPTEVLARQNYAVAKKIFEDYNVVLITGSMTATEKRRIKAGILAGLYQIVVGTHAILQEDVQFNNLSLCVCDEQQRFGVAQRSALTNKGNVPDVLVMSATPIPRTLSLIFYGDLDITTITDKPKDRIAIQTNIVPKEKYEDMLGFIEREIEQGKQAYLVCPKIDGDEEGTVISVTELFESIVQKFPNLSVGLFHGKMKDKEKNQVMQDFKDKKISLLVCTTVIEVGVDVPDATVMVIYNAERFGLSQLHQLRGRVGRSDKKSYCFLLTSVYEGEGLDRLKIIKDNNDGFKIAEFDYKLRGSGDFMGSRQSGKFMTDLGNLNYGTESIFLAKKISDEVFESGLCTEEIRRIAVQKYEKLKDITLN
ncbi:MAG: ATP-dependent DNA helicase RecG [Clostridia bacterium]|nr:ATP-dependent DNA helicase RecG [Clostridia bacterium]